jgi:hypothetical protein
MLADASGHGGARRGAGRPRVGLAELVRAGSFRATDSRHRRLLQEHDGSPLLPAGDPRAVELADLVGLYQSTSGLSYRSGFARRIEQLAREGVS